SQVEQLDDRLAGAQRRGVDGDAPVDTTLRVEQHQIQAVDRVLGTALVLEQQIGAAGVPLLLQLVELDAYAVRRPRLRLIGLRRRSRDRQGQAQGACQDCRQKLSRI